MKNTDPRTRIFIGLLLIIMVLAATSWEMLLLQCAFLLATVLATSQTPSWIRSLRLMLPVVAVVFVSGWVFYDTVTARFLGLRLFNLLNASFLCFQTIRAEEMGDALRALKVPYTLCFMLVTAMRYVPLLGDRIRKISDAQLSRGIDLRPRLRNVGHLTALLMPLLVQSFVLSEHLALAMESRGFGRPGRSWRRIHRLKRRDYLAMAIALSVFFVFVGLDRWRP